MSDEQLNQKELERARNFTKRVGPQAAADHFGISRQALNTALAVMPVRRGTITQIRAGLGTVDSIVVRGDAESTTKRRA